MEEMKMNGIIALISFIYTSFLFIYQIALGLH